MRKIEQSQRKKSSKNIKWYEERLLRLEDDRFELDTAHTVILTHSHVDVEPTSHHFRFFGRFKINVGRLSWKSEVMASSSLPNKKSCWKPEPNDDFRMRIVLGLCFVLANGFSIGKVARLESFESKIKLFKMVNPSDSYHHD